MDWLHNGLDTFLLACRAHDYETVAAYALGAVVALLLLGAFGLWIASLGGDSRQEESGTVVAVLHRDDTQESHASPVVTSDGVGIAMTSSGSAEAWIVVVKTPSHGIVKFNDLQMWGTVRRGETVRVSHRSNRIWGYRETLWLSPKEEA